MKKYLALLSLLITCVSYASPQGFSGPAPKRQEPMGFNQLNEPNTINGVLHNSKNDDYVLLQGKFIDKLDETTYIFEDINADTIKIIIENKDLNIYKDANYMIWCTVEKGLFSTKLNVELISTPLFK